MRRRAKVMLLIVSEVVRHNPGQAILQAAHLLQDRRDVLRGHLVLPHIHLVAPVADEHPVVLGRQAVAGLADLHARPDAPDEPSAGPHEERHRGLCRLVDLPHAPRRGAEGPGHGQGVHRVAAAAAALAAGRRRAVLVLLALAGAELLQAALVDQLPQDVGQALEVGQREGAGPLAGPFPARQVVDGGLEAARDARQILRIGPLVVGSHLVPVHAHLQVASLVQGRPVVPIGGGVNVEPHPAQRVVLVLAVIQSDLHVAVGAIQCKVQRVGPAAPIPDGIRLLHRGAQFGDDEGVVSIDAAEFGRRNAHGWGLPPVQVVPLHGVQQGRQALGQGHAVVAAALLGREQIKERITELFGEVRIHGAALPHFRFQCVVVCHKVLEVLITCLELQLQGLHLLVFPRGQSLQVGQQPAGLVVHDLVGISHFPGHLLQGLPHAPEGGALWQLHRIRQLFLEPPGQGGVPLQAVADLRQRVEGLVELVAQGAAGLLEEGGQVPGVMVVVLHPAEDVHQLLDLGIAGNDDLVCLIKP
mmetsp:Transcript_70186/g.117079  ORF Transcript_70186/g.117079 Transcript_70186/m.117079 type:complete len:529 (+) Transcript_70186:554-2140(+)